MNFWFVVEFMTTYNRRKGIFAIAFGSFGEDKIPIRRNWKAGKYDGLVTRISIRLTVLLLMVPTYSSAHKRKYYQEGYRNTCISISFLCVSKIIMSIPIAPYKNILYFLFGTSRNKKNAMDILMSDIPTVTMIEWYYWAG